MNETENQTKLRRAKASLAYARERETTARKELADAIELTRKTKERHDALFLAEETVEYNRRKSAYMHATK